MPAQASTPARAGWCIQRAVALVSAIDDPVIVALALPSRTGCTVARRTRRAARTLVSLDPTAVLERGYSITTAQRRGAARCTSVQGRRAPDTRLARGELESEVQES
jgi:hypothetical protein